MKSDTLAILCPSALAMRRSDPLFRTIFDDVGIGIVLMDTNSVVIDTNPVLQKLLGRKKPWHSLMIDGQPTRAKLLKGEVKNVQMKRTFLREDGSLLWLHITVSVVRDDDEIPSYLFGIVENITEQQRGDEALRSAEAKYRSIFENATEGIFQTSQDGRYLSANPALARIYGYDSPADLMSSLTNIARQLYVDHGRRDEFVRALTVDDQVHDFVSQIYRRDGSIIWISENCRAVRNDGGELLYYEGMVEDITERKRVEQQLRHDAMHDTLTGLPNRALFLDRLNQAMQRRQRHSYSSCGGGYAVLFIDCDRFKLINDSLGHLAGDQLLIELSQRINKCLRSADTLARLGGDEFAIIAEDLEETDSVVRVAERIRDILSQPFLLEEREYYLSISIGIANGSSEYTNAADLLRDADTAMYAAKTAGRSRYIVFERGMHLSAVTQLEVANDLRRALERGELRVYYQPIMFLDRKRLAGFEALVRWQHPERGLIMPDKFIPVAEETGLIEILGEQVMTSACRQLSEWDARLGEAAHHLFMSVNLSPLQLHRLHIVEELTDIVQEYHIDPSRIHLEITESGIMDNPLSAKVKLDALKAKGFYLSIDDFGTGYSSLAHLHRFPIDTLKVDRSFISPALQGGEHLEIIRTILTLGRALGMTVVAEGIESGGHDRLLSSLDCTYGQGWFYAKALPATEAETFILKDA